MSIKNMDFNTDIDKLYDANGNDAETEKYDYVSTVNVPCVYKPDAKGIIKNGLMICKNKNLTISALIDTDSTLNDEQKIKNLDEDEVEALVLCQLGALLSYTKAYSLTVDTIRPTGLLYKVAGEDFETALKIVKAVQKVDKWINYTCIDNEVANIIEAETTIPVNREISVDGIYTPDFKFDFDDKSFVSEEESLNRIRTILHSSQIKHENGRFMPVKCTTLHFNASNPNILNLLKKSCEIITPAQPNYNKAELSGWL